jgi:hypothetical protein
MPRKAGVFFDSVFVIESLAPGTRKTGTDLYDDVIAPISSELPEFYPRFRPAHDRRAFLDALAFLRETFVPEGRSPILHIEAHGNARGLQLGSGEWIDWPEFRELLVDINTLTRFNLLVVMAACKGSYLITAMHPTDRAPFWGVVGPTTDAGDTSMQAAMGAFYQVLLTTQDGDGSVKALNSASAVTGEVYRLLDAEVFFCWAYEKHEESSTDGAIEARVSRVVAAWAREHGPDLAATSMIRASAREQMKDHRYWYGHLRERFLMLDRFPENESRFRLTYDDCVARGDVPTDA